MISRLLAIPPRFTGLTLTKQGCNWQGHYSPLGDSVRIDGKKVGILKNPEADFKRFIGYADQRSALQGQLAKPKENKELMYKMQRHLQKRLEEGLIKRSFRDMANFIDFVRNAALFKEYAVYFQAIEVSPDKSHATFRLGYPNA